MFDWLYNWLQGFLAWLLQLALYVPKKLWQWLLEGCAALLNAIPVPDFIANIGSMFSSIPASVLYFAAPMHLGYGLGVVCGAYVIRFAIRRLPVVG